MYKVISHKRLQHIVGSEVVLIDTITGKVIAVELIGAWDSHYTDEFDTGHWYYPHELGIFHLKVRNKSKIKGNYPLDDLTLEPKTD